MYGRFGKRGSLGPLGTLRARMRVASLVLGMAASVAPAAAQPLTERTNNLAGTWVTSPRNLHFQFAHRFEVVGEDADISDIFGEAKVVNYPTFGIAVGLPHSSMAGVQYSSNSLIAGQVNEWQPFVKVAPFPNRGAGGPSLALTVAWNGGTQSVDGELTLQEDAGPLILIGALRGFTDVFDLPAAVDDEALAVGLGLGVRLNRYLTLAGDFGDLVAGVSAPAAWSAGLQVGIPFTPHTFSLVATNVTSGTLEGTSTGVSGAVFWGFEFTVPFSGFARWGRILDPGEELPSTTDAADDAPRPGRGAVELEISRFGFQIAELRVPAGTTVRWVNRDPVGHTATADDGSWFSPLIGPGETWGHTFEDPGRYAYHCNPHPFMRAVVIVE